MEKYIYHQPKFRYSLWEFYSILCCLNRREDLNHLIQWAERKNRHAPLRLYQNRLVDEEKRRFCYTINQPRLTAIAHFAFRINRLISGTPGYLLKGSARVYRYGWLTKQTKPYNILYGLT
jgi:hypothetical protein